MGVTSSYDPSRNASSLAGFVRRHDPDRFLTALFAPPAKREALFALYAFNHELARARETASEAPLALIRLQWWREVVEGGHRRHEIAEPLSAAIDAGALRRGDLLGIIDAREVETAPAIETSREWHDFLRAGAGGLAVAAARLLGAPDPEEFRPFGTAFGLAGLLRSVGAHARQGRCLLPLDALARHNVLPDQIVADPETALSAVTELAREGLALLRHTRLPRPVVAAALPAVLARRDLRRAPLFSRPRGAGDRLAVIKAGLTGRI
jgi:15-cis-phytoene synthase